MKNILEVIKENKGKILKRGLIILGAAAGLFIVGKILMRTNSDPEEIGENSEPEETEDGEHSEEE